MSGYKTLYHYTTGENIQAIANSGVIKQSTDERRDAVAGKGVYMTEIPPDSSKLGIAVNNYDGLNRAAAQRAMKQGKVDNVVKVKVPLDKVEKVQASGRNVWRHPGDLNLGQYDHSFQ